MPENAFAAFAKLRAAPLATPRLRLDPIAQAHADAMFALLQDPLIYAFIPDVVPDSVPALRKRYTRLARGASPDGRQRWLNWIVSDAQSGECMGYVQATVHADASSHFAYVFGSRWWGAGFALEAARRTIEFLRAAGILRLVATVDPRNLRSVRLLQRLGFTAREPDPDSGDDLLFEAVLVPPAGAAQARH